MDDPADPYSDNYQGYHTVDSPSAVESVFQAAGASFIWSPAQFIVLKCSGADAYWLQVSGSDGAGFDGGIVIDKNDFNTNEMTVPTALGEGNWYWRAKACGSDGAWGNWTAIRSFS